MTFGLASYEIWTRVRGRRGWLIGIGSASVIALTCMWLVFFATYSSLRTVGLIIHYGPSAIPRVFSDTYYTNLVTYHYAKELHSAKPSWADEVLIVKPTGCETNNCYLAVVFHESSDDVEIPRLSEIRKLFPKFFESHDVSSIMGHMPYLGQKDLIYYRVFPGWNMRSSLHYSHYSLRSTKLSDKTDQYLNETLDNQAYDAPVVLCSYLHYWDNYMYHRTQTYWVRKIPNVVAEDTLLNHWPDHQMTDHPHYKQDGPITSCPKSCEELRACSNG